MRSGDNMGIIILISILVIIAVMFMIYVFSTKIGLTSEEYTIIPFIDTSQ